MSLFYVTAGPWGAGLGRPLYAAEVDQNFYNVDNRLSSLESQFSSSALVSIASISQTGNTLTFHMTDGSTQGPFTLPSSQWNFRGVWMPSTVYAINDAVSVGGGVYLVLQNHTSGSVWDPGAQIGGNNLYQLLLQLIGGVPAGGVVGDVVVKIGTGDYQTSWTHNALPLGGTAGQILIKDSSSDRVASWHNNTDIALRLNQLTDVSLGALNDGDVLVFDGTLFGGDGGWRNESRPRGGTVTTWSTNLSPGSSNAFTFYLFNNTADVVVTLPNQTNGGFAIADELDFCTISTGVVSVIAGPGATIRYPQGYSNILLGTGAVVTAKYVDTDTWQLFGLLQPSG